MLPDTRSFLESYRRLEARMRALAEADGDVFLPNPEPKVPVDYVLICMEPSLGAWARSAVEARSHVDAGFRNFLSSIEDFILHFAAQHYLCGHGEKYHLTDLSKGAMLVSHAGEDRFERYERWFPLLKEEIELVARSEPGIVAVGKVVERFLGPRLADFPMVAVIHYSGLAARARNSVIEGHEEVFDAFRHTVTMKDLRENAERLLKDSPMPETKRAAVLRGLGSGELSESRQKLLFAYKSAFQVFRHSRR